VSLATLPTLKKIFVASLQLNTECGTPTREAERSRPSRSVAEVLASSMVRAAGLTVARVTIAVN